MPYATMNDGTDIRYTDWGHGSHAVVLVHAWGLSSSQWDYQLPALLEQGLRCVTYDTRGHGRSEGASTGLDHDRLADDLASLLDILKLRHVTLVGHSFGCGQVVRYVTRHGRDRVRVAVFLAPVLPLLLQTDDNADGWPPELVAANLD